MDTPRRDVLKMLGLAAILPIPVRNALAQPARSFVFASYSAYDSVDPHTVFDASRAGARFNLYDGLYRYVDNPPKLIPWLAEGYSISEDRKSYTFRLKRDVIFHDGKHVTADDVVYSIERILALNKGPSPLYQGIIKPGTTVALDPYTVVFNLSSPSAIFLSTVPDIVVVNRDLVKSHEIDGDWGEKWLSRNEAGSGSYKLVRFDPAIGWSAQRFEQHFAGFGSDPIDNVEFRNVLETNTRVLGLMRGDYHGADGFLPYDQVLRLEQSPNVQIIDQESMRVFLVALNNAKPPLDDVHFRRALSYSFDYEGYIASVMKGSVTRNPGPLPVTMWGSPPDLKGYTYDLNKAADELKKAKLQLRPLTIVAIAGQPESEQAGILFQSSLRQIGIDATYEATPWPILVNRLTSQETRPDAIPFWKSTFYVDPNNWVGEGFGSRYQGQRSLSYYNNPEFDKLLDKALISDNQAERKTLYEEMTRMVVDDAAGIFVYNTRWHGTYSKKVSGIRFSPTNNGQDLRWASFKP
ncbi:ABC transporter substrate-binding protein [Rhizobium calliandrae]|uniref:ABC transporter substrate-binding protein n=1 Tax=Rhizobium calliandrae TaxID=1312182 RepID=A0ABT7KGM7_9HYPH|nr:ABC transporter substrate-binding protein [Rhizobium calliandrae]MDL2407772.1 ABC transporter substrate-binding protein [Rhizobium calliandrae]